MNWLSPAAILLWDHTRQGSKLLGCVKVVIAAVLYTTGLLNSGTVAVAQSQALVGVEAPPAVESNAAVVDTDPVATADSPSIVAEISSDDSVLEPKTPVTDMQSVAEKFDVILDKFNDATDKLDAAAQQMGEPAVVSAEGAAADDNEIAEEILPSPSDIESAPDAESGGISRRAVLIASLTIFALAVFVGFEVITKVPPTLHTPLMSGSNAISGITVVGALLAAGSLGSPFAKFLGVLAVIMAMVNVVGGFMVTDRMLGMFRRR